jgi:hypothetical protein
MLAEFLCLSGQKGDNEYMTDLYSPVGKKPTIAALVRVSQRVDGNVHFANASGGYGYVALEHDFAARYEPLSPEAMNKLFNTYKPIEVTALEGEGSMNGFTNGETWNGFEVPRFTTAEVLKALEEGGHLNHPSIQANTRYHFDENTETLWEFEVTASDTFSDDFDIRPIVELLSQNHPLDAAKELAESLGCRLSWSDKALIKPEGFKEPVVVHYVGNGWCWQNMERFKDDIQLNAGAAPRM